MLSSIVLPGPGASLGWGGETGLVSVVSGEELEKTTVPTYDGLCSAIGGLLDLKGLSNGRTYRKAHYELIQHTYPYAWASIVDYETRTNSFDISQAEQRPGSSESETEKEITPKAKMLKTEVIGMDTTSN